MSWRVSSLIDDNRNCNDFAHSRRCIVPVRGTVSILTVVSNSEDIQRGKTVQARQSAVHAGEE